MKSGDVLIVAGKGHENYQEYKIKKLFSDKKCIKECILKKNKSLSIYWKTNIISEKLNTDLNLNKFNIHSASLNSKNIKKNQFFVGVKGKKFDGNKYASEALKNRASVAVIDKFYPPSNKNKIFVKNSLNTFSNIAAKIRIVSKINSIGITGSAGKTSLKELIGQSLSKFYKTSYSRNSFNNKFGVPLSLFNIKKGSKFGVFEIGMDKKGEIHNLSKFVQPSVGIITNISYAHIKNFKNLKEIAEAKSEIINNITNDGIIILNKDDKFFNMFKSKSLKKGLKIISISKKKISDINITKITKIKQNYLLTINVYGKKLSFLINKNFIDYSENILFCVAVLSIYFNIERLKKNLFLNFKPIDGRGNNIKLKYKNKTINLIDETYNSNPLSLNFSLQKFNRLNLNNSKKHLLLGDMRELGKFSKKLHLNAASLINKLHIDKVNVYGKFIKHTYNKIKTQKRGRIVRSDKDIMEMIENLNNNDYLLIKGSNSTGLNQIVSNIRKKYAL